MPEAGDVMEKENLVVARTYSSRLTADMAVMDLESCGIKTLVRSDDAGGALPFLDFSEGIAIMVKASDLEEAASILDDFDKNMGKT